MRRIQRRNKKWKPENPGRLLGYGMARAGKIWSAEIKVAGLRGPKCPKRT